jgi:ATP-dependent helicase/nuclease subunit A
MLTRLSDNLKKLNQMSTSDLKMTLSIFGANESLMEIARSLYERSLEKDWISIKTIHGFCLELLKRFPLETGLFPGIKICDDFKWRELFNESLDYTMANEKYRSSWKVIVKYTADVFEIFEVNAMILQRFIDRFGNFRQLYADFFDLDVNWIDLEDEEISDLLLTRLIHGDYRKIFADCAKVLSNGKDSDVKKAEILRKVSVHPSGEFVEVFMTHQGVLRKSFYSKEIKNPDFEQKMQIVASKVSDFQDARGRIASAKANIAFFEIAEGIISRFRELKIANHYLDFNDVILMTLELLKNIDWVMYKIDAGLDHVLVDEAQDTSPEQWEVIQRITNEFFSNYQSNKTIFAVGDKKQAIYSFHGTDVKSFDQAHDYFKNVVEECGQRFYNEPLNKSYRTTGNILSFVDEVFAEKFPRITHSTHRDPNAGVVEIVDIFEDDDKENATRWQSAEEKLSLHIVNFIKKTIVRKVWVESRGRAAQAEDFLILFRHRDKDAMGRIIDALKKEQIPVTGIDRIILKNELIVEDLIALAEFSLFPLDDLMCARVLKSPIIGISEEILMQICVDRKDDNLWNYIQQTEHFPQKLSDYINCALKLSPFDFFMHILTDGVREKFINRLGEKCLDALNEFLEVTINYGKDNIPSLPNFLEWFRSFNHEVKRGSFVAENAVRLMTVHASKGLQSPFVILADCNFTNRQNDKIIKTEDGILLWDFFSMLRPKKIAKLLEEKENNEHYRLLYVAMTRAEDFLCMLGKKHGNSSEEKSWYGFVSQKLNKFVRVEAEGLYRLGDYKTNNLNKISANSITTHHSPEIPLWFYEKLPLSDDISPEREIKNPQTTYGNCVHMLLNEMPLHLEHDMHDEIADQLMENFDLSDTEKMQAKIEAFGVIKKFSFLFDSDSLSEVSFAYDGKEGRIDKIAFLGRELWIVDFKTGIPKDIPESYALQLARYRAAVFKITGNSNIKTAILWTKNQNLVEIHPS